MIGRFFSAIWRVITMVRLALANLLFIALLVVLWMVFRGGASAPELPQTAALLLNPAGRVVDQRHAVDPLSIIGGGDAAGEVLITDLIDAVDYAREDARISALVMELDGLLYIGQSKALELAQALGRFRDAGKPVVAVGDFFTQDQYRLAVEADHIVIHPLGGVALEGYGAYMNYFAQALEKLSVDVHIFRAGEHKSLAEPFQRSDMSAGEKEITQRWLSRLWANYAQDVEARRGLEPGSLTALINAYPQRLRAAGGDAASLAVQANLVDALMGREARERYLVEVAGAQDEDGRYQAVAFDRYLRSQRPTALADGAAHIAIVTGQGNMLPGEQEAGAIGGDSLSATLRDAASRDGAKAIVLRVNTGGGSVFASQVIREEIARIRAAGTPVVVSMGAIAASGGYYIAAEADRIYATEATITGSIGVFAAFPTVDRLLARAGVYTDGVGTTDVAGGLRPDRPLAPLLAESIQISVDKLHEDFITLVAQGRGLSRDTVVPIADGRALAAGDALELGLIDALGGLEEAVEGAAVIAGIEDYEVISIVPPVSPQQLLLERVGDMLGQGASARLSLPAQAQWVQPWLDTAELLSGFADPRHLYMRCLSCGS